MKCLYAWKKLKQLKQELKDFEADDLLNKVGLEVRHSTAHYIPAALGIFFLGVAVGAGAALFCTPKSGRDLRKALKRRFRNTMDHYSSEDHEDYEDENEAMEQSPS